ncbi:MAG: hypothetical protein HYU41_12695 [Candidatus Rokubacteria bacterium]|nr:hypothetical protein [Candidatus Rokubacteria bacterium]
MTTARRLTLVLVFYLAADFVDASAPGVFFFDSALFLGTVVQSKVRSADAATDPREACVAPADVRPPAAEGERASTPGVSRTSVPATVHTPLARSAPSRPNPPAAAEDH